MFRIVGQNKRVDFDNVDILNKLKILIQKYKELKEKHTDIKDVLKDKEIFNELFDVIGEILLELRQLSEFSNETIEKLYNIYQNIMEKYNTIYQNVSEVELEEVNNYMELYNAKPHFPFSEYGFRQPADTELRVIPKDIEKIEEENKRENLVKDEIVKLNVDIDLFIVSLNKVIDIFNKKYNLVQEEKSSTNELMINNQKKSGFSIFERIKNAIKKIFSKNNIVADVPYVEVNSYRDKFIKDLKIEDKTYSQKELSVENNQEGKVETFGKGKWIRFADFYNKIEEDNYKKIISILKQKAPWLKDYIAVYINDYEMTRDSECQDDLYIFVDNSGKPHISICLNGDKVSRYDIIGAKKIELPNREPVDVLWLVEEEYRDVAKSFLINNKGIYNGKELFDYDEWNNRLLEYIKKTDEEQITLEDIPSLLRDYLINYSDVEDNYIRSAITFRLEEIKGLLAQYWGISEDEIYIGNISFANTNIKTVPYKVILGSADFENSQIESLGDLFLISGDANFRNSKITDINPLMIIGRNAFFRNSHIKKSINVKWIGLHAYFEDSNVVDIGENANLWGSKINKVEHLKDINRKDLLEEYKKRKEAYELEKNKSMGDSVISPDEAMKMFYNNIETNDRMVKNAKQNTNEEDYR